MSKKDDLIRKFQHLCAHQEKCKADIYEKLKIEDVDEETRDAIVESLVKNKFIDETRYANFYVRDKYRFNHWGKTKIMHALSIKHIPHDIIKEALENIDENSYHENLKHELEKKAKSLKRDDETTKKQKLIRFGLSKGYEYEAVYKFTSQILKDAEE